MVSCILSCRTHRWYSFQMTQSFDITFGWQGQTLSACWTLIFQALHATRMDGTLTFNGDMLQNMLVWCNLKVADYTIIDQRTHIIAQSWKLRVTRRNDLSTDTAFVVMVIALLSARRWLGVAVVVVQSKKRRSRRRSETKDDVFERR